MGGTFNAIQQFGQLAEQDRDIQRQKQADAELQQLVQQYADQPDEIGKELLRRGRVKESMAWDKHLADHRKSLAETARAQAETAIKQQEAKGLAPSQVLAKQKQFAENANPKTWGALLAAAAATGDQKVWDDARAGGKVMLGNDPEAQILFQTIPAILDENAQKWVTGLMTAGDAQKTPSAGSDYAQYLARYAAGLNKKPEQLTADEELKAKQEFFNAQRVTGGSSSDFGSFLADYMAGEAQKLGKTPDELGASWKAGATIKARKAFGQADDAAQRPLAPVVVQMPSGLGLLDRTANQVQAVMGPDGKPLPLPPTAEQRNRAAGMNTGKAVIDSIDELSKKINTQAGALAKITGAAERAKASANMSDDVSEYQALVSGFVPLLARAVGHVGVLTEQDVQSVKDMLPKVGDSQSLRDRKIARIRKIMAQMPGGGDESAPKKLTAEELIKKYGGG